MFTTSYFKLGWFAALAQSPFAWLVGPAREALLWIISLTTSSTLYLILSFTFSKMSTAVYSTSWPALMDSFTETANYLFLLWGICIKTPRFRDALSDTVSSINSAKLFYFYYIRVIIIQYCCKSLYNRPIVFMVPNFNSIIYILLLYFINTLCIRYYIQRICRYNKLAPYSWRSLNCFSNLTHKFIIFHLKKVYCLKLNETYFHKINVPLV